MARAKRIDHDRAEARRRYRAASAGADAALADDVAGAGAETGAPRPVAATAVVGRGGNQAARVRGAQPVRPRLGLRDAFVAAYRPLHLRDDLRRLPAIVRHWSVWGPVLVAVISTILPVLLGSGNDIARLLFSIFVSPGAVAGVFIAGYFAPTAAYLAGFVVAVGSSILFSVFAWGLAQGLMSEGSADLTAEALSGSILTAFFIGPLYGIFLGATAAWYKRFLALTAPARPAGGRPAGGKPRRTGARAKTR